MHPASREDALRICAARHVARSRNHPCGLGNGRHLAAFARLLLWTDPQRLPAAGDPMVLGRALRTWRPGENHRIHWSRQPPAFRMHKPCPRWRPNMRAWRAFTGTGTIGALAAIAVLLLAYLRGRSTGRSAEREQPASR